MSQAINQASHIKTKPMRVHARFGSSVEKTHYHLAGLPGRLIPVGRTVAPGLSASPDDDLKYRGGKTVPHMEYQNIYLGGGAAWQDSDVSSIEAAILAAMQDKRLTQVVRQYFPKRSVTCDNRSHLLLDDAKPEILNEAQVQALVIQLYDQGKIAPHDVGTCVFNLILPSGVQLMLGEDSSLHGLGGYHGSVHIYRNYRRLTLYYSANVYSEVKGDFHNGIAVFDHPWKNVVATLYHEMNEFRTDPDINDSNTLNRDDVLGWLSQGGQEIGDQPIFSAGHAHDLRLVFKEIDNQSKTILLPIQYLYSNRVHGAEAV